MSSLSSRFDEVRNALSSLIGNLDDEELEEAFEHMDDLKQLVEELDEELTERFENAGEKEDEEEEE
jgi:hypothetical protein